MSYGSPFALLRLVGAVLFASLALAGPVAADDHDDRKFGAYIHDGTCDEIGTRVDDIDDLDRDDEDEVWDEIGQGEERPATLWGEDDEDVDLSLDSLTGADHVITVHEDDDSDSPVIACGLITGNLDGDGGLLVELEEHETSGFVGRAYLSPDDDDETDITVGIWEVQDEGAEGTSESTPANDDDGDD